MQGGSGILRDCPPPPILAGGSGGRDRPRRHPFPTCTKRVGDGQRQRVRPNHRSRTGGNTRRARFIYPGGPSSDELDGATSGGVDGIQILGKVPTDPSFCCWFGVVPAERLPLSVDESSVPEKGWQYILRPRHAEGQWERGCMPFIAFLADTV